MPDDMLEDVIAISKASMEKFSLEDQGEEVSNCLNNNRHLQIAKELKLHMDQKWEPQWHVFLGKQFGLHAVHEKNRFVYFTFEASKTSFCVYKAS